MQVNTTRFGTVDVDEKELITFPWGLPGFEELRGYILLEYRNGPFQWMQSTEAPSVAFVVCPPGLIGLEYKVPESKSDLIELEREEDLLVLTIVSFNREKGTMRFHVRSPLIFNAAARIGYQWTVEAGEMDRLITPAGPPPETE